MRLIEQSFAPRLDLRGDLSGILLSASGVRSINSYSADLTLRIMATMVWNACDLQWSPHGNSEIDPSEKEEIVKRFELNAPKAVCPHGGVAVASGNAEQDDHHEM
ncbi:hypothetical protein FQN51_004952 [Onygenales sp. PD_10]|nr:hypothetical protein FQN51_004952 [Onygenales sp. PD_10]